jgi:hypothetical protein
MGNTSNILVTKVSLCFLGRGEATPENANEQTVTQHPHWLLTAGITCGKGGEHAESSARNAVHVCQREADVNGNSNHQAGDDTGLVAQSQTEDDIRGSAGLARISHILGATPRQFRRQVDPSITK